MTKSIPTKRQVIAAHPEAHCVLDHFPGMEGYRVYIQIGPKHWRGGKAFRSPAAAWKDAAQRLPEMALQVVKEWKPKGK